MPFPAIPPFLLARMKEPSTYAGLGALLGVLGLHFSAAQLNALVSALAALAGLAAVFFPERRDPPVTAGDKR